MQPQQLAMPFVSVIVPVYNDPVRIKLCVEALLKQTYPPDQYEVLVVDNGSTDATPAIVKQYAVNLLVEQEKRGSYAARNKGIAHARGEIIAFTDSDCIPADDWLANGVARLLAAPQVGLIGGKIDLFFENPARPTAAELYERVTAFPQQDFVAKERFAATANVFTYRHMFDRVGLFDATLKSGGDREWGNRVAAAGYSLLYADDTCVAHPARSSLGELYKKAFRVIEGLYRLKQRNNNSLSKLVKGVIWELMPPWRAMVRIYGDKRLIRHDEKLKAIGVLLSIKAMRAWARIQLYRAQADVGGLG